MNWDYSFRYKDYERVAIRDYGKEELSNKRFVEDYLSPTLREAKCGWFALRFEVIIDEYGSRLWVVHMYAEPEDMNPIRTVNVSGESKGFIAQNVFDSLW